MRRTLAVLALACASCGTSAPSALTNVVVTHPAPSCTVTTGDAPDGTRSHHPRCSMLAYDTNPPSHGDHYDVWASYLTYSSPVPWGFLVHSLEHGAVVLSYDPGDTTIPDVAAKLQAFVDVYPADPVCTAAATPWRDRLIIVPEPGVGPVAASAWGHVYTATCWDEASLRAFVDAHYAMSPEDLCAPGVDLSSTGWCPGM